MRFEDTPQFYPSRLDEEKEKDKRRTFSVSLNHQEEINLTLIKETFNIKEDGTALKLMAFLGYKCVTSLMGREFLEYLFKKSKSKPSKIKLN